MVKESAKMRHIIQNALGFFAIGISSLLGQSEASANHLKLTVGAGLTTKTGPRPC